MFSQLTNLEYDLTFKYMDTTRMDIFSPLSDFLYWENNWQIYDVDKH